MANSISINSMVADIMVKYDHNKNGQIDLKRPEGLKEKFLNPDERVRSKTSSYVLPDAEGQDRITISQQVYTMRDLFYAADANRDNAVTREELEASISKFDENKDQKLDSRGFMGWLKREAKGERDKFNQDFGEKLTDYNSVTF